MLCFGLSHLKGLRQLSSSNVTRVHGDEGRCAFFQRHQHSISCHKSVALNSLHAKHQSRKMKSQSLSLQIYCSNMSMYCNCTQCTLTLLPLLSMYSSPRPGKMVLRFCASVTHLYWTEHTLSTSGTSLLNSSKHPQEPAEQLSDS